MVVSLLIPSFFSDEGILKIWIAGQRLHRGRGRYFRPEENLCHTSVKIRMENPIDPKKPLKGEIVGDYLPAAYRTWGQPRDTKFVDA
jgi:hypothetical protein